MPDIFLPQGFCVGEKSSEFNSIKGIIPAGGVATALKTAIVAGDRMHPAGGRAIPSAHANGIFICRRRSLIAFLWGYLFR
jgi:hypothetical protein